MARIALTGILVNGTVAVLWLSAVIAWSRLIDPDSYGIYTLVMSSAALLTTFVFGWIGAGMQRHVRDPSLDQRQYLSTVLTLYLSMSALVAIGFFVAYLHYDELSGSLMIITGGFLITILTAWLNVSTNFSIASLRLGQYAVKTILNAGLKLALGVLLALLGWQAPGLLLAALVALLITLTVAIGLDRSSFSLMRPDPRYCRVIVTYGWPIACASGLARLIDLTDRYVILWLMDRAAVGQYVMASELAVQPVMLVIPAVSTGFLVIAAQAYEGRDIAATRERFAQQLTIIAIFAAPVLVVQALFAPELAQLVLGVAYQPLAIELMPLLSVAAGLAGLRAYYLDMTIHLTKRTWLLAVLAGLVGAANLVADLLLIPWFGLAGAAYATVLAHAIGVAILLSALPRARVLDWSVADLAKTALATLALVLGLWMTVALGDGSWFVLRLLIGSLVYLVVIVALGPGEISALVKSLLEYLRAGARTPRGPEPASAESAARAHRRKP
jgi:O-antigen/teichoic acid export membrane protein